MKITTLLFGLLLLFAAQSAFAIVDGPSPHQPAFVPGQLIVKFKQGQSPQELAQKVAQRQERSRRPILGPIQNSLEDLYLRARGEEPPEEKLEDTQKVEKQAKAVFAEEVFEETTKESPLDNVQLVKIKGNIPVEELERLYESLPGVEYAHPNYILTAQARPNDPSYPEMWNLTKIQAERAWDLTRGSSQVTVAVLDTGIDYTHPELGATQITERDFEKITTDPVSLEWGAFQRSIAQTIALNRGRVAYPSGNKGDRITVLALDTKIKTDVELLTPGTKIKRLELGNNLLAYYADKANDDTVNPAIYLYNLDTKLHQKIAEVREIGPIRIVGSKIIFGASFIGTNRTNIYVYDTTTGTREAIAGGIEGMRLFAASINLIVYLELDESRRWVDVCPYKAAVYDITTRETRYVSPPDVGPTLDIRGNKLLYAACSNTDFDNNYRTYYLFDISTGQATKLSYRPESPQRGGATEQWYGNIWSPILKGSIQDGIIFYTKSIRANRIIAFDPNLNRYAQINLIKSSNDILAEGNRVCFLGNDLHIWCHTYDPSNTYNLPNSVFNSRITSGWDFTEDDNDPYDGYGHGTHVAGTIGALTDNNTGVSGINWDVKLMAAKVLDDGGGGSLENIARGIAYAADNGARIINMSLGGKIPCLPILQDAIDHARSKNTTVVVAAGNDDIDAKDFAPASCRGVITVGATGPSDQRATYSNYGSTVDIASPGGQPPCSNATCILSTIPQDRYLPIPGTSMATPHVAGVAALMLSLNPNLTPDQAESIIKSSGDPISTDKPIGGRRLNAYKALLAVLPPTPTPTPLPTATPTPRPTPTPSPTPSPTPRPTATPTPLPTATPTPLPTATPTLAPTLTPTPRPTATPTPLPTSTPTPTPAPPTPTPCPGKDKGDANGDCTIDIADFNIWRENFLESASTRGGGWPADFNGDGAVDLIDFSIWRYYFQGGVG